MALKLSDYKTEVHNDWCPGCGDFGIVNAIQMALAEMNIPRHKAAIFSGIGCSGKTSHFIHTFGIHTLHGRVLTFAQGAAISNPEMTIVAAGFTFVARGYSYDVRHLKDLIIAAIKHKGLSFLDVLQPCPTYNDINTRDWYTGTDITDESAKETHSRIYKLEDTGYDPIVHYEEEAEINQKLSQALIKSLEWGTKIPTGIFYKNEIITPYAERLMDKIPNYLENPPARQKISSNGKPITDVSKILDSLQV